MPGLFIPGLLQGSSYQGYFRALYIRVTSQLKNSLFKWVSGTETELTISTVIKDQNAQVPLGQKWANWKLSDFISLIICLSVNCLLVVWKGGLSARKTAPFTFVSLNQAFCFSFFTLINNKRPERNFKKWQQTCKQKCWKQIKKSI